MTEKMRKKDKERKREKEGNWILFPSMIYCNK